MIFNFVDILVSYFDKIAYYIIYITFVVCQRMYTISMFGVQSSITVSYQNGLARFQNAIRHILYTNMNVYSYN